MKLIEDLGMQYASTTSKEKSRYGLYECPICYNHHRCRVTDVNLGKTTKCRECRFRTQGVTKSSGVASAFIEDAITIHGDKYDYSKVIYSKNHEPVVIICREHGEFLQSPANHKQGQECPSCADQTGSTESFISDSMKAHRDTYDYSKVVYKNANTLVHIICREHGVFYQVAYSHKRGTGCPSCARTGFDKTKPAILYYLKIEYLGIVAYKIGITNRNVGARFNNIDLLKIEVLNIWEFDIGADAVEKEQQILTKYKEYKYVGSPLLQNGNTELFSIDVLSMQT